MKRIYLDYAATTPLAPEVFLAMKPYWAARFGNPSSLHASGRGAREAIEKSRQQAAGVLGCQAREIIFTGSGTESDNLAIRGAAEANPTSLKLCGAGNFCGHIITSRIEHHAVLEPIKYLEKQGIKVTYLEVDSYGRVSPQDVAEALQDDTFLVSIMYANNEMGAIEPIAEIAKLVKRKNKAVLIHTDAVQAAGLLPLSIRELGIDLLSLSAHKFYGPKGVGILYKRNGVNLAPQILGGGQEFGLRSATENVAAIAGAAAALSLAETRRVSEVKRLGKLRDFLIESVKKAIPKAILTGHPRQRLPGNASFCFPGIEGEALVFRLSERGYECSSGSACSTGKFEPSHVLLALGLDKGLALGSLRISLGRATTKGNLAAFVPILKQEVEKLGSF